MLQTKEQGKNLQDQIHEDEMGNYLKKIQNRDSKDDPKSQKQNEENALNKHLEEQKNEQTVMKNAVTKIKNMLEGINSGITEAEEPISELEDRMMEITSKEQNKEKNEEN